MSQKRRRGGAGYGGQFCLGLFGFINKEPTPENACLGFGKWLVEQLALWEEDEGK